MRLRRRSVIAAQGAYYAATGPVPFLSRRLFESMTGPKTEWWLVQTVGALVTAVGAGLASAAARDRVTPDIALLAGGCAASFVAIDVYYVAIDRLAPSYLADAAVQAALLAALVASD